MKVLFFNYEYPPLGGGAGNATSYIMKEFSSFPGLEIDLITSSIDKEYHLEKVGSNIRIHRIPIGKNPQNLHYQSQKELMVYAVKAYFFARKLMKKNKYDLTHSFFTVPCGQVSWILKKMHKLPYVVSLRGSDVPGYSQKFSLIYKFINPLIRKIWKDADNVVSVSSGLRDLARKFNPDQEIDVIFNGINISEFQYQPEKVDTDHFRILCVSRLTQRKAIDYLIRAVANLKEKHPDVVLELVGDGEQKSELENLARELKAEKYIVFTGLVKHEEVSAYFNRASVFVLPSLNEGMSNVMLEALACGLPIVATDTGGTKELVDDGRNGFIIKMKDAKDIEEKVERLIADQELRKKMAQESRKKAEEMSWRKVADDYFNFYEKLAKK